jgi:predicted dehydrogenase
MKLRYGGFESNAEDAMHEPVKLAVVGAGLIGQRHIAAIAQAASVELVGVVEPNGVTGISVPCFASLTELFDAASVDGVILSTPTPLHVSGAMDCVKRGVPVLIEKPLATSSTEAAVLTKTAQTASVPILVGHHRRHNPLIQQAAAMIKNGAIGDVRAAQATCWFYKPDDYFDVAPWRKQSGAGPISVNLVHDVDLMRLFCGEVVTVQAQLAPSVRGYENEDLAAAVLRFESGAISTITVSDSVVSPWSWELTSQENPSYPCTGQSCYQIGGSNGSLSLPDMRIWQHQDKKSWWSPMSATNTPQEQSDPLVNQITHFCEVIRGTVEPLVSAQEGLRTLQVVEAIQLAATTQTLIQMAAFTEEVNAAAE